METKVCPKCGHKALYSSCCSNCGEQMEKQQVESASSVVVGRCPACNANVLPGDNYCENCGIKLPNISK